MDWAKFCDLLCARFPGPGEHDTMEQFQHLKQSTTVASYIDAFEEYMIKMQRDHPYLTDNFFLLRFISGLKETVKHAVKSHTPTTLESAYWHARQQELAYLATTRKPMQQNTTRKPAQQAPPRQQNAFRDARPRPASDKP